MAKIRIPDRERTFSPTPIRQTPGEVVGQGLQQLGGQIQKTQDVFDEKARLARVSHEVSTRYTDAIKQYGEWYSERASKAGGHKTLVEEHKEQAKKIRELSLKGVQDKDTKDQLTLRFNNYFAQQELNARSTARRQEIHEIKEKTLIDADKQADLAINSDKQQSQEIANTFKSNLMAQVEAGIFTKAKAEEINKKFNAKVQEGRIVSLMRTNPGAAHSLLKNSKNIPGLSPQRHLSLQRMAKSLARQRTAVDRTKAIELANSDIASIQSTGKPVPGAFEKAKATFTKKQFAVYEKKRNLAIQFNEDRNRGKFASPEEKMKILKERTPDGGDPQFHSKMVYRDRLQKEFIQIEKERRKDAGTFYSNHPEVSGEIPSPITMGIGQLSVPGIDPGAIELDTPGNLNVMAEQERDQKKLALQKNDRLPVRFQGLMPKSKAESIVGVFENSNPKQRIALFESLKNRYGKNLPIAMRDLVKAGLPASAMLYTGLIDNDKAAGVVTLLEQLGTTKRSEIEKGMTSDEREEIKKEVRKRFMEFEKSATLSKVRPPIEQLNTMREALTTMAMIKYQQDKSYQPARSAKFVVDAFIYGSQNIVDTKIPTGLDAFNKFKVNTQSKINTTAVNASSSMEIVARIPKKIPEEVVIQQIRQKNYMPSIMEFIKDNTAILAELKRQTGLPDDKAKQMYVENLLNNGRWVTIPDSTGLYLVDGNGVPVTNGDGDYYSFTFDEAVSNYNKLLREKKEKGKKKAAQKEKIKREKEEEMKGSPISKPSGVVFPRG